VRWGHTRGRLWLYVGHLSRVIPKHSFWTTNCLRNDVCSRTKAVRWFPRAVSYLRSVTLVGFAAKVPCVVGRRGICSVPTQTAVERCRLEITGLRHNTPRRFERARPPQAVALAQANAWPTRVLRLGLCRSSERNLPRAAGARARPLAAPRSPKQLPLAAPALRFSITWIGPRYRSERAKRSSNNPSAALAPVRRGNSYSKQPATAPSPCQVSHARQASLRWPRIEGWKQSRFERSSGANA